MNPARRANHNRGINISNRLISLIAFFISRSHLLFRLNEVKSITSRLLKIGHLGKLVLIPGLFFEPKIKRYTRKHQQQPQQGCAGLDD